MVVSDGSGMRIVVQLQAGFAPQDAHWQRRLEHGIEQYAQNGRPLFDRA